MGSASALALAGPVLAATPERSGERVRVAPLPLHAVRLKPSPFLDAVEANGRVLLALEPDRLLHNFHVSAGLPPKGEVYGGWEARGIAGHSLGHYLTACALQFAQTGETSFRERVAYTVAELARCQAAHGDGYIGGTTVERDGTVVDGKIVFEEIRRGDIRTGGFDINGGWVPLYTWHKVHAGLIDAVQVAGVAEAHPVLLGLAGYLGTILEGLSDVQMQKLLVAEYGGLNDSYAETYALTGDARWLRIAGRIRDRRVLDPLTARQNILPGLHANTQIPKLIGLARLHELTGDPAHAQAARFFRDTVVRHHSYVIGGNSDREHFGPPGVLSPYITDRTCEACNSYNMLKLTRHLWSWDPDAGLFDFYERVHLNHILGHQHPQTGMFAYFMPLSSGSRRTWSTLEDSFWCCFGSGLESHAKHGDSIYWRGADTLYVNLFIPSEAEWAEQSLRVALDTKYPDAEDVHLSIVEAPANPLSLALRLPAWSHEPRVLLNGEPAAFERKNGYAVLTRRWMARDRVTLELPMALRAEATPDDPRTVAFVNGPVVLAADFGPADTPTFESPPPALVAASPTAAARAIGSRHRFALPGARPGGLSLVPFYRQYDRRSAVYFPIFTEQQWTSEEAAFLAAARERAALAARTVDVLQLGEMQPERDHAFRANHADLLSWNGRAGRQAWWGVGNYIEFELAVRPGHMALQALYWGEEVDKHFVIKVDGQAIATERRSADPVKGFVTADYPIPEALTRGKEAVTVRFETRGTDAPVYEVRMLNAAPAEYS